ncbi:hypothetical protein GW17_00007378, partial [Ensete ventricosum]
MPCTEDCGSTPRFIWCLHPRTAIMMCPRHWINLRCCDEKICGLEMASPKEDGHNTWDNSSLSQEEGDVTWDSLAGIKSWMTERETLQVQT